MEAELIGKINQTYAHTFHQLSTYVGATWYLEAGAPIVKGTSSLVSHSQTAFSILNLFVAVKKVSGYLTTVFIPGARWPQQAPGL